MENHLKLCEDIFEPVKIFGNLYFVGSKPASVHIVDTKDGLIMFDTHYMLLLTICIKSDLILTI